MTAVTEILAFVAGLVFGMVIAKIVGSEWLLCWKATHPRRPWP